jgi:hypothetical protein
MFGLFKKDRLGDDDIIITTDPDHRRVLLIRSKIPGDKAKDLIRAAYVAMGGKLHKRRKRA